MQRHLASLTIVLLVGMVLIRVLLMKRSGIKAMHFGKMDKKDFLIPPFALFYFYRLYADLWGWKSLKKTAFSHTPTSGNAKPLAPGCGGQPGRAWNLVSFIPQICVDPFYIVFAAAFNLPTLSKQELFHSEILSWIGVLLCLTGLLLFLLSLISFGTSFRVGIDTDHPDQLVTTGVFALSRNPIYVAFWIVLFGQFLVIPNWILLVYLGAATALFHRQVLREEEHLKEYYGREYSEYCSRVRRYL